MGRYLQEKHKEDVRLQGLLNILSTARWIESFQHQELKDFGLTRQQYNVLAVLEEFYPEPVMLGAIQRKMLDPMSNASRLVDKLTQKGYIERNIGQEDRRQVRLKLTKEGLKLVRKAMKKLKPLEEDLQEIPEEKFETLNEVLSSIRKV